MFVARKNKEHTFVMREEENRWGNDSLCRRRDISKAELKERIKGAILKNDIEKKKILKKKELECWEK